MRKNLKYYKKVINNLPENTSLKRELKSIHTELVNTILESKSKYANQDYFEPKINKLYKVLRVNIK